MTRPLARPACIALAALALAAPLAAQDTPGTFTLPQPTPTPTPAPAGPADERAGVAIPPRAVPTATPTATVTPTPQPSTAPSPVPRATLPAPVRTPPAPASSRPGTAPAPATTATPAPLPEPTASADPLAFPTAAPQAAPVPAAPGLDTAQVNTDTILAFPAWQLIAAGLGALVLLGGGGSLLWRRRKPKVMRLAAPSTVPVREPEGPADLADLHISLDVTTATRSLMMFSLGYRLNIANRETRAVNDLRFAVQLVCARANGSNAPSNGAAQTLGEVGRIGPSQARNITGQVQLPLSAIQPLRQGSTPLFVPLVHVTLEGEGQPALTKTFVIGTRSASGRVHPIKLDQPPGGIEGLVAQPVAVPPASAAA